MRFVENQEHRKMGSPNAGAEIPRMLVPGAEIIAPQNRTAALAARSPMVCSLSPALSAMAPEFAQIYESAVLYARSTACSEYPQQGCWHGLEQLEHMFRFRTLRLLDCNQVFLRQTLMATTYHYKMANTVTSQHMTCANKLFRTKCETQEDQTLPGYF